MLSEIFLKICPLIFFSTFDNFGPWEPLFLLWQILQQNAEIQEIHSYKSHLTTNTLKHSKISSKSRKRESSTHTTAFSDLSLLSTHCDLQQSPMSVAIKNSSCQSDRASLCVLSFLPIPCTILIRASPWKLVQEETQHPWSNPLCGHTQGAVEKSLHLSKNGYFKSKRHPLSLPNQAARNFKK